MVEPATDLAFEDLAGLRRLRTDRVLRVVRSVKSAEEQLQLFDDRRYLVSCRVPWPIESGLEGAELSPFATGVLRARPRSTVGRRELEVAEGACHVRHSVGVRYPGQRSPGRSGLSPGWAACER
jgi:hypothetical protein